MEKFAKLFEFEEGQILFVKTSEDEEDKPCIEVHYLPEELGICKAVISFPDSPEGEKNCDKGFELINEDNAYATLKNLLSDTDKFLGRDDS